MNGLADVSSCDTEPIHIPGSIQQHGVLLACNCSNWTIQYASANTAAILGIPAADLIGSSIKAVLGPGFTDDVSWTRGVEHEPGVALRQFGVRIKGQKSRFDVTIHEHEGRRIVELEPIKAVAAAQAPMDLVRVMLSHLQQARSLPELCNETVVQIKNLIGFDRVMIYRFLTDGSGQVIAEAKEQDQAELLNLRYPATDIPRQARELYKRNWVRVIANVGSTPVALLAAKEEQGRPLDLSFADLRSVSPVHIEYLKNMGVDASMSISIIVGGELWGLIACHHRSAREVPSHVRAAAELLGQVFSLQIQTVEGIEAYVTMRAARALLDRIVAEFPVEGDLVANLASRLDQLAAFVPCDGVGILLEGAWSRSGTTPSYAEAQALAEYIENQRESGIWSTHCLGEGFRQALDWPCGVRGVLAVPLSYGRGDWLFFFRGEVAQTITWAGDPSKEDPPGGTTGRLTPRKSFEAWQQVVKGQCQTWTSRERLIADTLRVYLLDIIIRFREVILEERRQAEQRQRLMLGELNYRVKATLELIQSLMLHGFDQSGPVQKFVRTLEGRIKAISLAHDAISTGSGAQLRHLVETAVSMEAGKRGNVVIEGADIQLDPKAYTVLALVIHELAANSAATGALASPIGTLKTGWHVDPGGRLVVCWEEHPAPAENPGAQDSLGPTIVNRKIPHALGGEARIEQDGAGLRASLVIPARYVSGQARVEPPPVRPAEQIAPPNRPLEGYTILVVEDQILAAAALERLLSEHGAAGVLVAGTVEAALALLNEGMPDVAILDVDLDGETSVPVAEALMKENIPFVFAATDADAVLIPSSLRHVHCEAKPYIGETVVRALKEALLPHLIRAVLNKLV